MKLRSFKLAFILLFLLPISIFVSDYFLFHRLYDLFEGGDLIAPLCRFLTYGIISLVMIGVLYLVKIFTLSRHLLSERTCLALVVVFDLCLFFGQVYMVAGSLDRSYALFGKSHQPPDAGNDGREKINVLVITIDSLRRDHFSPYGYDRNKTPNLNEIAKHGTIFQTVTSSASFTYASVASILTSTPPYQNGVRAQGWTKNPRLATILEELASNGYATGYSSGLGLARILKSDQYRPRFNVVHVFLKVHKHLSGLRGFYGWLKDDKTIYQTISLMDWLYDNRRKPFFFWVHYYSDPHVPYQAPYPFNQEIQKVDIDFTCDVPSLLAMNKLQREFPGSLVDYIEKCYNEEIDYVDAQVGVVIQTLETLGLLGKTLVVVSADHGEGFGEHLYFIHGNSVFEEEILVPLIFNFPGAVPSGKVVSCPVSTLDIVPTILNIIGVTPSDRFVTQGVNLLPMMWEEECDDGRVFYSESSLKVEGKGKLIGVKTRNYKLIYDCGEGNLFLYDLDLDPFEKSPIDGDSALILSVRREVLEKLGITDFSELCPEEEQVLPEELKSNLKALGYLQ